MPGDVPSNFQTQSQQQMQLDMLRAKSPQHPDHLVDQLDALYRTDSAAFTSVRDRLSAWRSDK